MVDPNRLYFYLSYSFSLLNFQKSLKLLISLLEHLFSLAMYRLSPNGQEVIVCSFEWNRSSHQSIYILYHRLSLSNIVVNWFEDLSISFQPYNHVLILGFILSKQTWSAWNKTDYLNNQIRNQLLVHWQLCHSFS